LAFGVDVLIDESQGSSFLATLDFCVGAPLVHAREIPSGAGKLAKIQASARVQGRLHRICTGLTKAQDETAFAIGIVAIQIIQISVCDVKEQWGEGLMPSGGRIGSKSGETAGSA